MYYKAPDKSLHSLEDEAFEHLLPAGSVQITDAEYARLSAPPPPTLEQMEAQFTTAIQQRLDDFARARGYDGILSACTYATSAVPKFKTEGQRAVELRDSTWAAAYDLMAQVKAGTRPMPANLADIEDDLPALEWPQ